jgi:signal recognition particle receptor subunit beta
MSNPTTPVTCKIVLAGGFHTGKTAFIRTINEYEYEIPPNDNHTVAMDFGRLTLDDAVLYLFGTPPARRFDFMWEILAEGFLGFIVMIDSRNPYTFRETRSIANTFAAYAPTPYVFAANFQDHADAWDVDALRVALQVPPAIPIVPCVATDKNSVKNVLLALCYAILKDIADEDA